MKKNVGLWIDHKKAIIVTLVDDKETITHIESDFEGHFRKIGGARSATPYGPQEIVSEHRMEEKHKHLLRDYYQNVIVAIQDADNIFLFGPGQAKIELEKEIKKIKQLASKNVGVEPADRMTDNQIVAKVTKFFRE